jgi:hypothetical protein
MENSVHIARQKWNRTNLGVTVHALPVFLPCITIIPAGLIPVLTLIIPS